LCPRRALAEAEGTEDGDLFEKEVSAMPGGDRTGPWGQGPGTGGGFGGCVPFGRGRGFFGRGGGRGFGRGLGRGFGLARGFFGSYGPSQELEGLKAEISMLDEEKAALEEQVAELEKSAKKSGK